MNIIKVMLIGIILGLSACAHDTVKVPSDCDVVHGDGNSVTIVCPHRISVKR